MPARPAVHVSVALLMMCVAAAGSIRVEDIPGPSPFLPPASEIPSAPTATGGYDFVGMTIVGSDTLVSILRHSDRRSLWIPVGKTVADITVVSYDAAKDEAMIQAEGRLLPLAMRKSMAQPGAMTAAFNPPPTPSPAMTMPALVPAGVPAKPIATQEEKETEARMLVSDLLEIGQQQRKAYAEAQRQAAAQAAAAAKATTTKPVSSHTERRRAPDPEPASTRPPAPPRRSAPAP